MMLKSLTKNDKILNHFFIDFSSILASILEAIFLKNRSQEGERVKGTPSFYHLRFLSPFWGTPRHRFSRFWTDFASHLEGFFINFGIFF